MINRLSNQIFNDKKIVKSNCQSEINCQIKYLTEIYCQIKKSMINKLSKIIINDK